MDRKREIQEGNRPFRRTMGLRGSRPVEKEHVFTKFKISNYMNSPNETRI